MSFANEYYWQGGLTVARMFMMGRVIPLGHLDRAFTLPGDEQEFSDAYAEGLSLVRFMRDQLRAREVGSSRRPLRLAIFTPRKIYRRARTV